MIVVDTSAIIAIVKRESGSERLLAKLHAAEAREIAAANYVEAGTLLAHLRRGQNIDVASELDTVLAELLIVVPPTDAAQARAALEARIRYGKGFGVRGGLNYGDSFAYALAKVRNAPLLFVGDDFTKTDITSAIA